MPALQQQQQQPVQQSPYSGMSPYSNSNPYSSPVISHPNINHPDSLKGKKAKKKKDKDAKFTKFGTAMPNKFSISSPLTGELQTCTLFSKEKNPFLCSIIYHAIAGTA